MDLLCAQHTFACLVHLLHSEHTPAPSAHPSEIPNLWPLPVRTMVPSVLTFLGGHTPFHTATLAIWSFDLIWFYLASIDIAEEHTVAQGG